ncbi:hypothetical protein [Lysinibacillus endophyticus]|nr:hypothetical protein [Lysinibacillus endophyticus]
MWVVTIFEKNSVRMFEFLSKNEANNMLANVNGSAILSFTK